MTAMYDAKVAVVMLLAIFHIMLMIECNDQSKDCYEYDMRKPPRFGKRSTILKALNPCPVSKRSTIPESIDSFETLAEIIDKLKSRASRPPNVVNPYKYMIL